MATSFRDFEQLDTLLNKPDECPLPNGGQPAAAAQGPGSIPAVIDDAVIPKPKAVSDKSIWDEEDLAGEDGLQIDASDTRLRPEYDILYKQEVSANDCFLGLDWEKDPSSACCNEIVVKVELPGDTMKEIDLDVQKTKLTVQSKKHILPLALPYPCDPKNGSAAFDSSTSVLSVTLPIVR